MTRVRTSPLERFRLGWQHAGSGAAATTLPTIADYLARPPHPARQAGVRAASPRSSQPLVSVVTPVWNGARTVERALASVRAQTYPVLEHIIVDGGSTDATVALLRAQATGPGLWLSEPDAGLYDAINKGIALAAGRYVKILNADDVLPPDSVATAMRAAAPLTEDTCIRGDLAITDDDDRVLKVVTRANRPWFLPDFFPILHPSWYLPRAVYERLGLYSTEYRVAADWEYFLRLHAAGVPILHVDHVLAEFRRGGLSGGYGGLPEGFEINARYLGRRQAAVILACMSSMKAAADAIRRSGARELVAAARARRGQKPRG